MFLNKKKLPSLVKKSSAMPMPGALKSKFLPHGAVSAVKDGNNGIIPKPSGMPPPGAAAGAPPTPGSAEGDIGALLEQAAQAAEGALDPELEDLLVDYMHGDMTQPPAWATDMATWTKAAEAVGLGKGDTELAYEEPFVVAAYLYKMMGGPTAPAPQVQDPVGEPAGGPTTPPPAAHPVQKPAAVAKPPMKPGAPPAKPGAAPPAKPGAKPAPGAQPEAGVRGMAGKLAAAKGGMKPPAPGAKPGAAPPKPGIPPAGAKPPAPAHAAAPPAGQPPAPEGGDVVEMAAQQAMQTPDPEVEALAATYDPEVDGNPPSWAADAEIWSQAESQVKPRWEEFEAPWMVVAHVYKALGGNIAAAQPENVEAQPPVL